MQFRRGLKSRVFVPEQKTTQRGSCNGSSTQQQSKFCGRFGLHSAFPGRRPCQETQEEDSFFTPASSWTSDGGSRGGHVEVPRAAEPAAQRSGVAQRFAAGISAACRIHRAQFFDLILQALQLPAGKRDHHVRADHSRDGGHRPQAWTRSRALDLNLESMAPEVAALQTAITPRTSALVIAHLFGTRAPMRPLIDVAKTPWTLCV